MYKNGLEEYTNMMWFASVKVGGGREKWVGDFR